MNFDLDSPDPDSNWSGTTRRDFLKRSVATSIAATAAGMAVAGESAAAMLGWYLAAFSIGGE